MSDSLAKQAGSRQFVLRTFHPSVGAVDGDTFWQIWRDGFTRALTSSAKLNTLFQQVAEQILVMVEADDAAPPEFVALAVQIIDSASPEKDDGGMVIPRPLYNRLRMFTNGLREDETP